MQMLLFISIWAVLLIINGIGVGLLIRKVMNYVDRKGWDVYLKIGCIAGTSVVSVAVSVGIQVFVVTYYIISFVLWVLKY